MINLPKFKIGELEINLIQGGMGVGISRGKLAGAVANCGGAGIIASVALGLGSSKYPFGKYTYTEANQAALCDEIRAARKMSNGNGAIGVNIMYALTDYEPMVKVAVEEGADLMITGAGFDMHLPELVGDSSMCLAPIVSKRKAAEVITRAWKKYDRVPDAFIVEGPEAGGHLGFKYDDLVNKTAPRLEEITKEVIDFANDLSVFEKPVPVIAAGGIYTGQDIKHYHELGAAGVQMATRFVTTLECDADDGFKKTYLDATEEDIKIILSPVGMPGRAINNDFLEKVMGGEQIDFKCMVKCIKPCKPRESLYCIIEALDGAQNGKFDRGFAFAGSNAYRCTEKSCLDENRAFITVETLMQRLSDEYHSKE